MLSPSTRRLLTNLGILAVLGGGGYWFYTHQDQLTGDQESECAKQLQEVLDVCTPVCTGTGRRISVVREQTTVNTQDQDCMDKCSTDKFGYTVPQCGQRHH